MKVNLSRMVSMGIWATGVAIAPGLPLQAQIVDIPVTGGRLLLNDTSVFVPGEQVILLDGSIVFVLPDESGAIGSVGSLVSPDERTVIYSGEVGRNLLIQTRQGNIPLNAIFSVSTNPILSTPPNGVPAVGDVGSVLGTLTFRGFTAAGEPAFFNNVPTELEFQVTSILPTADQLSNGFFSGNRAIAVPTTEYSTLPTVLDEAGSVDTSGGSFGVGRSTDVVFVQFQPDSPTGDVLPPVDLTNPAISADAFIVERFGVSYFADIQTQLTGGAVSVPVPPGFGTAQSAAPPPRPVPIIQPIFDTVPQFTPGIWNPTNPFLGSTQFAPVLPNIFGIAFVFTNVPSGFMYDPPIVADAGQTSVGFEFEMTPRPVAVGLPSRVFPGITGEEMQEDATFTAITEFPQHINLNNPFTVSVEGQLLGEFNPGDTVVFSDYADQLGDLLVDGQGVTRFVIGGIEPGIDLEDPRVFPVRLEFSTDRASFEMRPADDSEVIGQTPDFEAVPPLSDQQPVPEPTAEMPLEDNQAIAPDLEQMESLTAIAPHTATLPEEQP